MKTDSPEDADIIVQKIPSDVGMHRIDRKATMGAPETLLEDYRFDSSVMVDEVFIDEFDLEETHRKIRENTSELAAYDKPLISLGGDHSISYELIRELKERNPEMELVWLDSHLDLKEKIGDHISHDVVVREILDLFDTDEIHFLGVTRVDHDEEEMLEEKDLEYAGPVEATEVAAGIDAPVYLSLDIDVLKSGQAPGTGYPDGEMSPEDVKSVIKDLNIQHADLVEVAPPLDEGRTVENARALLSAIERTITG